VANEIARRLRKTMTPQEVKLWVNLRSWRQRDFHFRRQSPRGGSIVDFVCMRHRLIVEVDGGQHNFDEHTRHDRMRDQSFERSGFKVLRFWNNDVDRNPEGVLATIDSTLQQPTPPGGPAAQPGALRRASLRKAREGEAFAMHPPPTGEG
jgi:very-short-patch-repair endonuclease